MKQKIWNNPVIRILSVLMALALMVGTLAACNKGKTEETTKEATKTIIFPANYYEYFDYKPSEDAEAIKELGKDYYTKVAKKGDQLQIEATSSQIRKLIARNNYYCSELQTTFLGAGDGYAITGSDDYKKVEFILDDKMDEELRDNCIFEVLNIYAMNQLLKGAGDKWNLEVTFINNETGDTVKTVNCPADDLTLTTEELSAEV